MKKHTKNILKVLSISFVGYLLFHFSKSGTELLIYSLEFALFSFLIREIVLIISDAKAEIKSYEERKKSKYLEDIKPTLTPTEKLYLEAKKNLPYKILKEDLDIFRSKMKNRR